MVILIILPIIIAVSSMIVLNTLKTEQERKKAELKDLIASLERQLSELNTIEKERDLLKKEKAILEYVTGKTYKWSKLLEEIRNVTPINLWISSFTVDAAYNMSINGKTFDHKTVALFVTNLLHSSFFSEASIVSTNKDTNNIVSFVISGKLRTGN
jgi:Tfp pilus assembly protein PilN